jgi:hypothetical protein
MTHWRTTHRRRKRKLGLTRPQVMERREDRLYGEQLDLIAKEFTPDTDANLGWGVTGDEHHLDVATKVYAEGRPVLRSVLNYRTGRIRHQWL